nr:helix-turn-helix domain-containing protein [Nocardia bovistercoris]
MLEAGRAAFSGRRYDEVSVVDLARSLGVAAGSVSYHFGGKRGLYLAVVEQAAQEFWSELLELRGPALDRLTRGVDAFLDRARREPGVFEALITDVADAEVRAVRDRHRGLLAHALAVEITGAEATPVLRAAVDGCLSFIEGIVLHWLRTEEISREQVRALILANFVATVLGAAHTDPEIELSRRVLDALTSQSPLIAPFVGPDAVPLRAEVE